MNTPENRAGRGNPGDTLRDIEHELEGELGDVESQIAETMERATAVESLAMAAIQRGDDRLARQEMIESAAISDTIGKLAADAHVLRCLLAEIREFCDTHTDQVGLTST
jgi:phage shock protein A